MEIQAQRQWYELDFSVGRFTATQASTEVEQGRLQADELEPSLRMKVKDELFSRWLTRTEVSPASANAIEAEHSDFFDSIRKGREPRVTGLGAIRALEVACAITSQITNSRYRILRPAA
jgi:predicted dehydrogenase